MSFSNLPDLSLHELVITNIIRVKGINKISVTKDALRALQGGEEKIEWC